MTATPIPLPAWSGKLRNRRFQVWIGEPNGDAYTPIAEETRFATFENAARWADNAHPCAPLVIITRYSATNGWAPTQVAKRQDGEWL